MKLIMKFLKRIISVFFDMGAYESKPMSPLEREKMNAFLMLFPF